MLDLLGRFNLWLRTDALNLLKIFAAAALLVKLLRWLDARLVDWAKREPLTAFREQQLRTLGAVLNSVGTVLVLVLAGMMALHEIGLDVRPILAGAGLAGLAVGFGAQNLVHDVINGFFIVLENQYGIGDVVRISGIQGTVEQMTLRRTVLRDNEGAVHNIPNGEIHIVANLSRDWSQVYLHVPVGHRQNVDRVVELLEEVGRQLATDADLRSWVLETPRVLGVDRMTGAQVELLMQVRTAPGRQFDVSRELRRRIKVALERAGIPTTDPHEVLLAGPGAGDAASRA